MSLSETLLRFLRSTQSLILPVFFLVGTKFETQLENLIGEIILESYIIWISFLIEGNRIRFIFISFCLKGF